MPPALPCPAMPDPVTTRTSLTEIGSSGLKRYAGRVSEDSYLRNMSWDQQVKIYTEMGSTEPIVGGGLFAIDNLMRQVEWSVEPNKDGPAKNTAQEDADFLDSCRDDMSSSWVDTISEAITFLQYGWAYHEVVYKRRNGVVDSGDPSQTGGDNSKFDDGKVGWRKIALRAQETLYKWEFDDKGGIMGMWQSAPPDYEAVLIPINRALLFRTTTRKNDPQGASILRAAYRPWFFKRRIEEVEGVGIERDLAGLPYAGVDPEILSPNATPAQTAMLSSIKDMLVNVRRDAQEGIIFPLAYDEGGNLLYEFKLMSSGGSRQLDVSAAIDRKSNEIAMTMLADFILLGHQGVGTYALSADKTELFQVAITTFLDIIASIFNQYAVPRLFAVNGMPVDHLPKIVHGKVTKHDLASISAFVTAMVGAGLLTPDTGLMEWVRTVGDMPDREEGAPIALAPPATTAIPPAGGAGASSAAPATNAPPPAKTGITGPPQPARA